MTTATPPPPSCGNFTPHEAHDYFYGWPREKGRCGGLPVAEPAAEAAPFAEWVILELMGHRRLAGRLTEQEIAGKGFLRLDVPAVGDQLAASQLYNPASVYCITPTTEDVARAVATRSTPAPVSRWELEPARPLSDVDGEGPF